MRNLLKWGAVVIGFGAIAWLAMLSQQKSGEPVTFRPVKVVVTQARGKDPAPVVTRASAVHRINYRTEFAQAHDYADFARTILPAAQAGDPDAEYYLYEIDHLCTHPPYFEDGSGTPETLDKAIQLITSFHGSIAGVQLIYDHCHQFFIEHTAPELGDEMQWLARATQAGQTLAKLETADLRLTQEVLQQGKKAGSQIDTPLLHMPPIGGVDSDPYELVRSAIVTLDPDVLWRMSTIYGLLTPDLPVMQRKITRLAWMEVACGRGFDCSAGAEWVVMNCQESSSCGGAVDIPAMAGDDWPTVQARAQEINAHLDAGEWDQLGLGLR